MPRTTLLQKSLVSIAVLLLAGSAGAEMRSLTGKDRSVSYVLTRPDHVTIELRAASGEFIRTLVAGEQPAGAYRFEWDGTDGAGKSLPPGTYRLQAGIGRKAVRDTHFARAGFIQFGNPCGVTVDANGDLYVLDRNPPGLFKFNGDGAPRADFLPAATNFLAVAGCSWFVISDTRIFHPNGHSVEVREKTGRLLYSIGGWNPDPRDPNDQTDDGRTPEGKRGLYWGGRGGALGADNRLYVRNRDGLDIKVFDWTIPNAAGWLFTERRHGKLPPLSGIYAPPCFISDGTRKLYSSNVDGTIRRFDDQGNAIALRYQSPRPLGGDVIGMGLSKDMLYVTQRTPAARIYQLWDNEEYLALVSSFEDETIQGLRDVAVSPDGRFLYLLEDGDNFGKSFGDLQGRGRLFKYALGYAQELERKLRLAEMSRAHSR